MTDLNQVMKDIDGNYSSKRTIAFISFSLIVTAFVANMLFDLEVSEFMFDGVMWIVISGLGFSVAERFGNGNGKGKHSKPDPEPELDQI